MEKLLLYTQENGIGLIQVARPEARNALNWAAQEQFGNAVAEAAADQALRVLLITGSGDEAFVAGGDIKELANHPEVAAGQRLQAVMSRALDSLTRLPVPVIAVINGDAYGGGCEILTACDLRLAAHDVRLGFVQVKVGLTTGWGGTLRLVRLLGQSRAMELLLTGRVLSVDEALAIGFVHKIVPRSDLMARAYAWAAELMQLPRTALAANKQLVTAAAAVDAPSAAIGAMERILFTDLWPHPDHLEAMNAFVEKRPPLFNQNELE